MRNFFLICLIVGLLPGLKAFAAFVDVDYNPRILRIVKEFPEGGGYNADNATILQLQKSIRVEEKNLNVEPREARPSFCSGATYLVFTKLISELQAEKKLNLSPVILKELEVQSHDRQPDGVGVWGRWNADGPGTARLFYELKLGPNFLDLAQARPGDFLKIFWNDKIGRGEKGHSVIFLEQKKVGGENAICYWSSNIPAGLGEKCVARKKMRLLLFSRLEHPENLTALTEKVGSKTTTYKDDYLMSLATRTSTAPEMCEKIGCQILP